MGTWGILETKRKLPGQIYVKLSGRRGAGIGLPGQAGSYLLLADIVFTSLIIWRISVS